MKCFREFPEDHGGFGGRPLSRAHVFDPPEDYHEEGEVGVDFMGNSFSRARGGPFRIDVGPRVEHLNEHPKNWGKVTLRTGGVTWYRQSRLTVWGNQSFNRLSLFDRGRKPPWNGGRGRYNRYVEQGLVDMGLRYGSRAFQGIFLGMKDLPGQLEVKGVLGKVTSTVQSHPVPNFASSWRVSRSLGSEMNLASNTLTSQASSTR